MKLSPSIKAALVILGIVLAYFLVRSIFAPAKEVVATKVERQLFTVIADEISPQEWRDTITLRGRTEAIRKVFVRAETSGTIAATPANAGQLVKEGDVLCRLKVDARKARYDEALALRRRAQLDYDAAKKLAKEGFRSETSLAALKAAYDQANAGLEQARLALSHTEIVAPFDGVFDDRTAEVGDFLKVGDPCGVVIQQSPFLITGAVSEKEVAKISVGDKGEARLATGEFVAGSVRFVATAADPSTRTFDVELEVPNPNGELRDGVTAEFDIFASASSAHHLPRSALTLDDRGRIGVRVLDAENFVQFNAITLIGEDETGIWVAGLPTTPKVILRGQDFVREGQEVKVAAPEIPR